MAQKSNKAIDNDLSYQKLKDYINHDLECQMLKVELEKNEIEKGYNNEKLLKYVVNTKIENEDIPPTDSKVETGYITRDEENGIGYLHYLDGNVQTFKIRDVTTKKKQKEAAINELKDLANEYGKEDPRIKKEKADDQQVDVEKLLSALKKITNKLLDLEYYNATIINELSSYINEDPRIIRGSHLKKDSINKLIHDIDNLISDAEDYLDANELMILYFGIYLARIKNKEIRNKGARKIVNAVLHPPVQDLI
jgi:hypothetical protein